MANLKTMLQDAAYAVAEARRKLEDAQRTFDSLYLQVEGKSNPAASKEEEQEEKGDEPQVDHSSPKGVVKGTIEDRLVVVFKAGPDQRHHFSDLAKQVGTTPNSVRFVLNKMQERSLARRVSKGWWRAGVALTASA